MLHTISSWLNLGSTPDLPGVEAGVRVPITSASNPEVAGFVLLVASRVHHIVSTPVGEFIANIPGLPSEAAVDSMLSEIEELGIRRAELIEIAGETDSISVASGGTEVVRHFSDDVGDMGDIRHMRALASMMEAGMVDMDLD